ncbi:MAG: calcium/proton exchanger [Acidobacteriota bacterium]|jgi:Ca2+:H+ antiporter
MRLKPSLDWLLLFVPLAIGLDFFAPERATLIFVCACVAVIPLAGWLGKATEHLAERTSAGIGGLLNATFGNAAELIIALLALRQGLTDVVKASITGSIIGNILLVMGVAFLAGGIRFKRQRFNVAAARVQATMLTLAAIALIMPAVFHHLVPQAARSERTLSMEIAVVLIVTYGAMLLFSLHTHRQLFTGPAAEAAEVEDAGHEPWSLRRSLGVLVGSAAVIGWVSEVLVGSVEAAAHSLGMTEVFVGVIVVAVVGNAAEHSTAILMAVRNRMDLAVGIAVGSSIQIALFVAPVLLFASYFLAPEPMDLVFTPAEVVAVGLGILITGQIAGDGESNWLEGVQLLVVYLILGIIFYFLPAAAMH